MQRPMTFMAGVLMRGKQEKVGRGVFFLTFLRRANIVGMIFYAWRREYGKENCDL